MPRSINSYLIFYFVYFSSPAHVQNQVGTLILKRGAQKTSEHLEMWYTMLNLLVKKVLNVDKFGGEKV